MSSQSSAILNVVVWNVEWRPAGSPAGMQIRDLITRCEPDLVCITEGTPDFLDLPYRIEAEGDYGYSAPGSRRKVLLWSRHPWHDADTSGDPEMPPGRYVAGRTMTPLGRLSVCGICIPWSHAHVTTGRRDRKPWEEHLRYLGGLRKALHAAPSSEPRLVMGDYNQSIPRRRAPLHVFDALAGAFPLGMNIATAGRISPLDLPAIDHVSHSAELEAVHVRGLSNVGRDNRKLSDHFGLHLSFRRLESGE